MQFVYGEDARYDVPIDYLKTAQALWRASSDTMMYAFPDLDQSMKHLIQMGVDHDPVQRKLVSYQTMEARIHEAEKAESSEEQQSLARKLVMVDAGVARDGVWFETFEGPMVILYTVTNLYMRKPVTKRDTTPPRHRFHPASAYIRYREEEKETHIDQYIIGIDRAVQQEAARVGRDVVEKKLAFRDYVTKGQKLPVMPRSDYLSLWRILRLDAMSDERKRFREQGDRSNAFRQKIDIFPDPQEERREEHIEHMHKQDPGRDVRLQLAREQADNQHEVIAAQLHRLEQLIQNPPTESKAEKYGSAFLVAIAAGIALIFWEAVV